MNQYCKVPKLKPKKEQLTNNLTFAWLLIWVTALNTANWLWVVAEKRLAFGLKCPKNRTQQKSTENRMIRKSNQSSEFGICINWLELKRHINYPKTSRIQSRLFQQQKKTVPFQMTNRQVKWIKGRFQCE